MKNIHVQQNKAVLSSSNINRRLSAVTNGNTPGLLNGQYFSEQSRVFFPRLCCAHYCHWALTRVPHRNESSQRIFFGILHPPGYHQIPPLRTAVEVDKRPEVWKWAVFRKDFRRRFRETCTTIGNVSRTMAWPLTPQDRWHLMPSIHNNIVPAGDDKAFPTYKLNLCVLLRSYKYLYCSGAKIFDGFRCIWW
jgi:hypothetical protein